MTIEYQKPERADNGLYEFSKPKKPLKEEFPSLDTAVKIQEGLFEHCQEYVDKLNQTGMAEGMVDYLVIKARERGRFFSRDMGVVGVPYIDWHTKRGKERVVVYADSLENLDQEDGDNQLIIDVLKREGRISKRLGGSTISCVDWYVETKEEKIIIYPENTSDPNSIRSQGYDKFQLIRAMEGTLLRKIEVELGI